MHNKNGSAAATNLAVARPPYHPVLASFPARCKMVPSTALLCLPALAGPSDVGVSFLGGGFPLPYMPETRQVGFERRYLDTHTGQSSESAHLQRSRPAVDESKVADASTAAKGYLNTVLRGIQACQGIWRDDIDKERVRWLDELEDAARTHGSESVTTFGPFSVLPSDNLIVPWQQSSSRHMPTSRDFC
jgi:hypothetical protein